MIYHGHLQTLTPEELGLFEYCITDRLQCSIPRECFTSLRLDLIIPKLENLVPNCTDDGKILLESLITKLKNEEYKN